MKRSAQSIAIVMLVVSLLIAPILGQGEVAATNASLSETQRNSIAMLNYLTVLTQKINLSKNSRLYLEEAYSALLNNTSPNAVDNKTLAHLSGILDTLEGYRMISLKRERLQYVFDQGGAQAIRSAIPNPIGTVSAAQAVKLPQLALSLAYMAFDAYTSYSIHKAETDLKLVTDGWALDDEEAATLHNMRKAAFSYMVEIINENGLPGDLALTEGAVNEFVSRKSNSNDIQLIQFLESNRHTYQAMGEYWLTLAECYFRLADYQKCLDAVTAYENLDIRIFRKDVELAKVLPMAIAAAKETQNEEDYTQAAVKICSTLLSNSDNQHWALRFFVAQTYVNLYTLTKDESLLRDAYTIALNNVNYLVVKQKAMNASYLADLLKASAPKDASQREKKDIDEYNRQLSDERKRETAPIYEPLLLNCDLLFALAEELNVQESEKAIIDGILHENGSDLFLIPAIDDMYRFNAEHKAPDSGDVEVTYRGSMLSLPVILVTSNPIIRVQISNGAEMSAAVFEDWEITSVERKNGNDLDGMIVNFHSPTAKAYEFVADAKAEIEVSSRKDSPAPTYHFSFIARNSKKEWWESVKLWEDDIVFDRVLE